MQSEAINRNYGESVAYDLSRFDNRRIVREALANEAVVTPDMPRAHTRAKAKTETKVKPFIRLTPFSIVSYVVIIALVLMIVMNYMTLNEIAVDTSRMQKELTQLESDGAKLLVEYERAMNVGDLAAKATAAGMYSPGADQVGYVDISRSDKAIVHSTESESGFFENIEKFFLAVGGYFE